MTTLTTKPIVFVVDDDITVRESLKALIEASGWQAETFASAKEFLARPRPQMPSSPPTCLFKRPETTSTMTSRSRAVSNL